MKKNYFKLLGLVFILLAMISLAWVNRTEKEPTRESVEAWHNQYWNYFSTLEFDKTFNCYADDLTMVYNNQKMTKADVIKSFENADKYYISWQNTIDSSEIKILDNNTATITGFATCINKDTSNTEHHYVFNYSMVINKTEKDWEIILLHEYVNPFPLMYTNAIQPTDRMKQANSNFKFLVMMSNSYALCINELATIKKLGMPVEDFATQLGDKFAGGWPHLSFDEFCNSVIYRTQAFSSGVKLIEHTDDKLIISSYKDYKRSCSEELTDEEFMQFWEILNGRITEKMGISLKVESDGDYMVSTYEKL
ncbi:MAG: hypothetical protein V2I54_11360 [Bacteroidales bacterium]|jgi:hypothetical protein|nr:hypothetical protein [Bacteroidales bacterium]